MRAVLVGAVESTRVALEAIDRAPGWRLTSVVTLPPELADRHSDFAALAPAAARAGAAVLHAANINEASVLARIRAANPDFIFVIGWSQICHAEFMRIVPGGVIGYHPAALPRLRGRAAMPWTILNNEPITASTLFWIDDGVDSGPILDQLFFHVAPEETITSLYQRHMEALGRMMDRTLAALAQEIVRREPQDERCATWAARRTGMDGRIDWTAHSRDVARLIRAVGKPYPGAFTYDRDAKLTIWMAESFPDGEKHLAAPGQIVAIRDDGFIVKCGHGSALLVSDWASERAGPLRQHRIFESRP